MPKVTELGILSISVQLSTYQGLLQVITMKRLASGSPHLMKHQRCKHKSCSHASMYGYTQSAMGVRRETCLGEAEKVLRENTWGLKHE